MCGKELILTIGSERAEIFLEKGFFFGVSEPSPIHKHRYAEVHLTETREMTFYVNNEKYTASPGYVSIIPQGVPHRFPTIPDGAYHFSFFINYPVKEFTQFKIPREIITELREEASLCIETGRSKRLSKYLVFLCKDICTAEPEMLPFFDREFIIHDFFENKYHISTISLGSLAELLSLSHKQTERLVRQYTGNSFSKELTRVRIEAAKMLLKTDESLTLSKIAQMVGYNSYSGFWKAFRAH